MAEFLNRLLKMAKTWQANIFDAISADGLATPESYIAAGISVDEVRRYHWRFLQD